MILAFTEIATSNEYPVTCDPFPLSPIMEPGSLVQDDRELKIEAGSCRVELPEFPIDRPWLPQNAIGLLNKLRTGPITENELMKLIELVSDQATTHFQLKVGKFVATTFFGRIVEISDSRVGLLKKIQGRRFSEEIFVWKVGSDSFSGRT